MLIVPSKCIQAVVTENAEENQQNVIHFYEIKVYKTISSFLHTNRLNAIEFEQISESLIEFVCTRYRQLKAISRIEF